MIDTKSFPVKIQSKYDVDWYTDEYGIATKDNILCYLTPESPAITQLKRVAIDEMSAMTMVVWSRLSGISQRDLITTWVHICRQRELCVHYTKWESGIMQTVFL